MLLQVGGCMELFMIKTGFYDQYFPINWPKNLLRLSRWPQLSLHCHAE